MDGASDAAIRPVFAFASVEIDGMTIAESGSLSPIAESPPKPADPARTIGA
jgi:hypothetical protein